MNVNQLFKYAIWIAFAVLFVLSSINPRAGLVLFNLIIISVGLRFFIRLTVDSVRFCRGKWREYARYPLWVKIVRLSGDTITKLLTFGMLFYLAYLIFCR